MKKFKLTPDKRNEQNPASPFWDNTDLIAKILYRLKSHGILFGKALRKNASFKRLLITRFPYQFEDSKYPPSMHIEFTSACNLKCRYCNNPHFSYPREVMSDVTFYNLISKIEESKIDRICIGGGEATLHPKFTEFVPKLSEVAKILTIVSNGHWKSNDIPETLLKSVDFIEISVESGSKADFENMRVGSSYDLIIQNLTELKRLRRELNSKSHINLRLMVRPSQKGKIEKESLKFWSQYGDSVMPQYVLKTQGIETISDAFTPLQMAKDEYPKCSLPFRNIQIRANGDVPICQISGSTLDSEKKLITGNVNTDSINKIWREGLFKQYRTGHRQRDTALIPICKGCKGC